MKICAVHQYSACPCSALPWSICPCSAHACPTLSMFCPYICPYMNTCSGCSAFSIFHPSLMFHPSVFCLVFAQPFSAIQVHALPSRFSTPRVIFNSQDWLSMNLVKNIVKLLALEDKSRFFHVFQFGNKLIYVGILTFHLLIFFSHHLQAFFCGYTVSIYIRTVSS